MSEFKHKKSAKRMAEADFSAQRRTKGHKKARGDRDSPADPRQAASTERDIVASTSIATSLISATAAAAAAQDATDFPRGGGTTLTPFEHKQALNEVKSEAALRRKERAEKKPIEHRTGTHAGKASRKSNGKAAKLANAETHAEARPARVEVLNYKRLNVGMRLLCSVLDIQPLALIVSLPNQLVGHIPITNISGLLTQRLDGADERDNDGESDDGDDDNDDEINTGTKDSTSAQAAKDGPKERLPELHDLFTIGQWVQASVVAVKAAADVTKRARSREGGEYEQESQRVELTLDPEVVNDGVSLADLTKGFLLPLTVTSREDHGYLVSSGIRASSAGGTLSGFVAFSNAGGETFARGLTEGQVVQAAILSVAENRRTFTAKVAEASESESVGAPLSIAPNASALLPGNLVTALIVSVAGTGLNVKLFGLFDGTIDAVHMDHRQTYRVGQRVPARILWEQSSETLFQHAEDLRRPDAGQRQIALSAAPNVVALKQHSSLPYIYPVGARCTVTVLQTIDEWGLMCRIEPGQSASFAHPDQHEGNEDHLRAFVHISACSDEHVADLPETSGPYRVGTTHAARVTGHALTDGIVRVSLQPSILRRAYMRVSDVAVGDTLACTIRAVNSASIMLDFDGPVDGVVFGKHLADVLLKKPERRFKVGQTVKARVLQVEPGRNRVAFTLKPTLVDSTLPIVASVQDARVGIVTHGVFGRILPGNVGPSAVLVELYGPIRVRVPLSEIFEASSRGTPTMETLQASFFDGKCVKVRLTRVDYASGNITASIRQASDTFLMRINVDAVQIGQSVTGRLAAVHAEVVVLELVPSNVRALLSLSTLAKVRNATVTELKATLTEGEVIDGLKVTDKNAERGIVIVGGAQSTVRNAQNAAAEEATEHSVVTAEVVGRQGNSVKLRVGGTLQCHLHATDCCDDFSDVRVDEILPRKGTTLQVYLLSVKGAKNKRADVSIRPSRLSQAPSDGQCDREINGIADLRVGEKIRGFVKAKVDKAGLFVDLGRSVTSRVKIGELFDAFHADWKSKFELGQVVQGTVIGLDKGQNKVELSLRSKPGAESKAKRDGGNESVSSTWASLQEGAQVDGFVRNVTDFGVFVQLDGTTISGLAHKSQLSDDTESERAIKAFSVGDRVKAVILALDRDKKKISFGLKASLLASGEELDESAAEVGVEGAQESDSQGNALTDDEEGKEDVSEQDEDDSKGYEDDEDEGDEGSDDSDGNSEEGADDDDDDNVSFVSDASDKPAAVLTPDAGTDGTSTEAKVKPALLLQGGLTWAAGAFGTNVDDSEQATQASSDEDDEQDASERRKRRKRTAMQEDMTAELVSKVPQSAEEFERVLLGSPNSSFLWIQFMAFAVQLGNVEKAREVARRALQVIHFREEEEKLNVWLALLKLELTYGDDCDDETLQATFADASRFNDARTVHLRFAEMLEQGGKVNAALEHWKRTAKKYGLSAEVWIHYHRFLLRCRGLRDGGSSSKDIEDEVRSTMARSMQSLDKRDHVQTIVAYALNECKLGDVERGRTMFEGLVDSHPKRLDIWLQYVDQEIRIGHPSQVRDLFERVLALKLSRKKCKSVLNKWYRFEQRRGDAASIKVVEAHALRIVEERKRQERADESDGEDGSDEEE